MPRLRSAQITNVIYVLLICVLIAIVGRRMWTDAFDPAHCSALLTDGQWLDPPYSRDRYASKYSLHDVKPRKAFQAWQPPACMLHQYRSSEIASCGQLRKIFFVGDSTARQVFWATVKKFSPEYIKNEKHKHNQHADIDYTSRGMTLHFIWDPFLNSSVLHKELTDFRDTAAETSYPVKGHGAFLMLVGAGLHHARHLGKDGPKIFETALANITTVLYGEKGNIDLGAQSLSGPEGLGDQVFFMPLDEPLYDILTPSRATTIVPDKVKQINKHLRDLSDKRRLNVLWSFPKMTHGLPQAYEESGIHVLEDVASKRSDIILNLRCNAKAMAAGPGLYNRTCCSNYPRRNWIDWALLILSILLLPLSLRKLNSPKSNWPSVTGSMAIILFALLYCHTADRTTLFAKVHKLFVDSEFRFLCGASLIMGLLTIRRTLISTKLDSSEKTVSSTDRPFLSREQTDEWKGWMQLLILIYHYTGASGELRIYETVRLTVASYLFLTGYGHTTYFLQRRDYSFHRVASVLIRLNLLCVTLAHIMRTDYLFYYFSPLVSFWFVVIYFTLSAGQSRNDILLFLFVKIILSGLFVTIFIRVPGILEAVFTSLKYTTRIHWDVREARFRLSLDQFIIYIGMLVATLNVHIIRAIESPRGPHPLITRVGAAYSSVLTILATIFSPIIISAFWLLTARSPDKYDYNWWNPYISFLPILSFVVLRNCHRSLRNMHSTLFAWMGRISLETYTLQYHIWLAGDTKGLLSTGLFRGDGSFARDRWRDFVLLTPIFIWVSWRVAGATGEITKLIIGKPGQGRTLPVHGLGVPAGVERWVRDSVKGRVVGIMVLLWLLNIVSG